MRDYDKITARVKSRGEELIAARKRRSSILMRTACAVSGICAAIAIGIGLWNSDALKGALTHDPDHGYVQIDETTAPQETTAEVTETTVASVTTTADTPGTKPAETVTAVCTSTAVTAQETGTGVSSASAETEEKQTNTTTRTTKAVQTTAVSTTKANVTSQAAAIELPSCQCYLTALDAEYVAFSERKVDGSQLDGLIGSYTVRVHYSGGYNGYDDLETTYPAKVYRIKSFSPNAMVAVSYNGGCYSYRNPDYTPENLNSLLTDLDLRNSGDMARGYVWGDGRVDSYTDLDIPAIIDILAECPDSQRIDDPNNSLRDHPMAEGMVRLEAVGQFGCFADLSFAYKDHVIVHLYGDAKSNYYGFRINEDTLARIRECVLSGAEF